MEFIRPMPSLSHRHNDVSDLKISNLVRRASVRPVTVLPFPCISQNLLSVLLKFLTSSSSEIEVPYVFS